MGGLYLSLVLHPLLVLHVRAVLDSYRQCGVPWSQLAVIPQMEEYNRPDAIVEAVTTVLTQKLSDFIDVDAVELREGSTYVCCAHGLVNGFQRIMLEKTLVTEGAEDTTDLHITYSFKNLNFGFSRYTQHMPPIPDITGSIDVTFEYTAVELMVNTESYSNLVSKLRSNDCFVRVKHFAVKSLLSQNVLVYSKSRFRKYLTRKRLNLLVQSNQALFRKRIEAKLQIEFYKALAGSGSWICKDNDLLYPILESKYGYTEDPTFSLDFDTYCGSADNYRI